MGKFELLILGVIAGLFLVPIVFDVEITSRSQVKSLNKDDTRNN
jgi:hypothetical protein